MDTNPYSLLHLSIPRFACANFGRPSFPSRDHSASREIMSADEPSRSHLKQEKIDNPAVDEILLKLGEWLRDAALFSKHGENLEKCVDIGMKQACEPLLSILDLDNKVWASIRSVYLYLTTKIKSRRWGYTVLRTGPGRARFHNTTGSAYLVPIRIIAGRPSSSGIELKPGWTLYITDEIEVGPGLDGLFIAEL